MQGVYVITSGVISALAAAKTVILVELPATVTAEILSARIRNVSNETNEQLEFALTRVTTKGAPAGSTPNVAETETRSPAHGLTLLSNLTTEPTTYETAHLDHDGGPSLSGYDYRPDPEERPIIEPSGLVGLRIITSTFTAIDCLGQVVVRVVG